MPLLLNGRHERIIIAIYVLKLLLVRFCKLVFLSAKLIELDLEFVPGLMSIVKVLTGIIFLFVLLVLDEVNIVLGEVFHLESLFH